MGRRRREGAKQTCIQRGVWGAAAPQPNGGQCFRLGSKAGERGNVTSDWPLGGCKRELGQAGHKASRTKRGQKRINENQPGMSNEGWVGKDQTARRSTNVGISH